MKLMLIVGDQTVRLAKIKDVVYSIAIVKSQIVCNAYVYVLDVEMEYKT